MTPKELIKIIAVADFKKATTATQDEGSPFSSQSLRVFYNQVAKNYPGAYVMTPNTNQAIKIGYNNTKKAFYSPAAEGHIFFKSITEGIIPVHKILRTELPDLGDFKQGAPSGIKQRSSYGTFSYNTELTIPKGGKILMLVWDGIAFWLDYLPGRKQGAYQLYWVAAPLSSIGKYTKDV